ncbi:hypothetical protein J437_LFUL003865 [Ladona fulva]|uniref:CAF1B/HIR1 beta-propeller domain-containing protein n=1 Tax=Ladona fulva TaxID=123851 RepID=A0A8K0P0R1_LADFU|nr:hypothetical protein J437_LFUL003865 [Ladona fulva]
MKCIIPEISWHNRDPVLSVDIQPRRGTEEFWRLASGGTDAHVLIWYITIQETGVANLEFAADLLRHQKAVNVVRFSPSGEFLASGDDESVILIWKQKTDQDLPEFPLNDEEGNAKEQWISLKVLRGHVEDVYDLCWSPDSNFLISGSVDNSAILWDVQKGRNTSILKDHKGFVQGVAWDPQNQYVATMSSDRLCRIFSVNTKRVVHRIYKSWLPGLGSSENPEEKVYRLYHDDTLKSFFRRLSFTPDGELLITPAGVIEREGDQKDINVTYIYSRHLLNRPVVYLPTGDKYTIAVRCCPVLFELRSGKKSKCKEEDVKGKGFSIETGEEKMEVENSETVNCNGLGTEAADSSSKEEEKPWEKNSSLFALPYRIVFAVATEKAVLLYDTQQPVPFAKISNIHYTRLTDITWSSDGRILVVSSTDGYCSAITFNEDELGVPYKPEEKNKEVNGKKTKDDSRATNVSPISTTNKPITSPKDKTSPECKKTERKAEAASPAATKSKKNSPLVKKETRKEESSGEQANDSVLSEKDSEGHKLTNSGNSTAEGNHEEMNNASPTKHSSCKELQSPDTKGNTAPIQELKKTPRRVKLITLSSPKSKKRPFDLL